MEESFAGLLRSFLTHGFISIVAKHTLHFGLRCVFASSMKCVGNTGGSWWCSCTGILYPQFAKGLFPSLACKVGIGPS